VLCLTPFSEGLLLTFRLSFPHSKGVDHPASGEEAGRVPQSLWFSRVRVLTLRQAASLSVLF
jgi:hypothetical protein